MANLNENGAQQYNWEEGVYQIEKSDPVEGGPEGTSNRQGASLALRTRNLHDRLTALKQQAADIAAELETLTGAVDTKDAATLSAAQSDATTKANTAKAEAVATAAADASTKSEATLRGAKTYTDTREGITRTDYANADVTTLRNAKTYADQVVAALVDGSPEALNTLQELARALGNDPNFATTVMQLIGERATTIAMNAALAGKASVNGDVNHEFRAKFLKDNQGVYDPTWNLAGIGFCGDETDGKIHRFCSPAWFKSQLGLWHAGNFNPETKFGFNNTEISDLNNAPLNTFFFSAYPAQNTPAPNEYASGFTIAIGNNAGFRRQFCTCQGSTWWYRSMNAGSWGGWVRSWDSESLKAATTATAGQQ